MAGKRRTRRAFGTVRTKSKRLYAEYTGPDGNSTPLATRSPTALMQMGGWRRSVG